MSAVQEIPQHAVREVFGDRVPLATQFAEMLAEHGIERGLIGPRELDRLWDRHLLNSAVIAELMPANARVVDIGSGAGLPGIPLAIARPDLQLALLEPMARRIVWLEEVVATLGLSVEIVRGRAEEKAVIERLGGCDVVTARAVAPLERLAGWSLPLLRQGGQLVAMKGATADEELERDAKAVARLGGINHRVALCGTETLAVPTVVIAVERGLVRRPEFGRPATRSVAQSARRRDAGRRKEKDR